MYNPIYSKTKEIEEQIKEIDSISNYYNSNPLAESEKLYKEAITKTIYYSSLLDGDKVKLEEIEQWVNSGQISASEGLKQAINYSNAISYIYDILKGNTPITEENIKELHSTLFKDIPNIKEGYRNANSRIGNYSPPDFFEIPTLINELASYINSNRNTHPLIFISIIHYRLIEITPFFEGNIKISLLLTKLLMLKLGYSITNYFSIEKTIYKNKDSYVEALTRVDITDASSNTDLTKWIEYFLSSIKETVSPTKEKKEKHAEKNETEGIVRINKNQRKLLEFIGKNKTASRGEYVELTGLSKRGANNDLNRLIDLKLIEKLGKFKSTYYILTTRGKEYIS